MSLILIFSETYVKIAGTLRHAYVQELDCEGCLPPISSARVPQAVLDAGVAVFDFGGLGNNGQVGWVSQWTAIYADEQFYISAPELFSASSKQSLVSVLSLAEPALTHAVPKLT